MSLSPGEVLVSASTNPGNLADILAATARVVRMIGLPIFAVSLSLYAVFVWNGRLSRRGGHLGVVAMVSNGGYTAGYGWEGTGGRGDSSGGGDVLGTAGLDGAAADSDRSSYLWLEAS